MKVRHLLAIFFLMAMALFTYAGNQPQTENQPQTGNQPQTATEAANKITSLLSTVCSLIKNVLGVMAIVLFAMAGVIYAAGQFFGAELRGRASSWAMAALAGAIIAIIIYSLGPAIINSLWVSTVNFNC